MYEELIESLRELSGWDSMDYEAEGCGYANGVIKEAADAIEELSKKRVGTWHRIKGTKKAYLFICNSCGEMYPYLTACCPFCGVKYKGERAPKEEAT